MAYAMSIRLSFDYVLGSNVTSVGFPLQNFGCHLIGLAWVRPLRERGGDLALLCGGQADIALEVQLPPFWVKALPTHGGDPSGARSGDASSSLLPQWSPQSAIDLMDSQEIAVGILSLTAPGIVGWDKCDRPDMARPVNEYTADLVTKRPDRFGNFAMVPLPDFDGTLLELEYALDTLRADGVILLGNCGEKYLGDASFEPLWPELDRRQAVVFVHPGLPPPPVAGVAGRLVDYPFGTTERLSNSC
jgi:6-methylsalicylate decarboxylase